MVSYILGDARDTLTLTSSDTSAVDLLRAEGLMPELRFVHSTD